MDKIEISTLTLEYEHNDDFTLVNWVGQSQEQDPYELLFPSLKKILDEAKKKIILNFKKLEYINSSTINPIIRLIKTANERKVYCELQYNPEIEWQKPTVLAFEGLTKTFKYLSISTI